MRNRRIANRWADVWVRQAPGWTTPGRKRRRTVVGRPVRSGGGPVVLRRAVLAVVPVLVAGGVVAGIAVRSTPSDGIAPAVSADTVFTIAGRGNGHGRGMGQWGAFGYAKEGWSAERILGYYYGGTALAPHPPAKVAIRLMGRDDRPLDVYSDTGMIVAGQRVPAGQAVRLAPTPGGGALVTVSEGCGGAVQWEQPTDNPWVDPVDPGPNRPANEFLKLCDGDVAYRGALGVAFEGVSFRTVNAVDVDDYLYGVVPREMQPNWADQGGAEALRAQAIAARSYVLAESRYDYAQSCDTQSCQVYGGAGVEDPRTTDAVRSTSGTVLMRDGQVVRAEYSASTGGATAGGDFPGVVDAGDGSAPEKGWSKSMTAAEIGQAFGVGELTSIAVTGRDPAGRVTNLHVEGTGGAVDVSGEDARGKLGLDSDWFDISEGPGGPPPAVPAAPAPDAVVPAESGDGDASTGSSGAEPSAGQAAIEDKYRSLGGLNATIGAPVGPVIELPEGFGMFRIYTGGVILWTPDFGAQELDLSALAKLLPEGE
ncbi:SpoIID/LytB domain-containing protein [Aldersonia sp. NBC_00410]|uniref:SpoIID/LytB domain-containing protein n=1 Tax=Aldersonia sp. NBC_00410 TaxID=2975954 RepID=UPI00225118A2|nr:SpoIID/LytB domain-containing protein [Aldersonia sp. NBC_00410]MCX5042256.1 SpoIID/LytB domain-containing protein [Aldersonia sp. NBC_00410]